MDLANANVQPVGQDRGKQDGEEEVERAHLALQPRANPHKRKHVHGNVKEPQVEVRARDEPVVLVVVNDSGRGDGVLIQIPVKTNCAELEDQTEERDQRGAQGDLAQRLLQAGGLLLLLLWTHAAGRGHAEATAC